MKTTLAFLSVCLLSVPALASEATVTKSHLCCPGCVKAVESTLGKVEGLSNVSVDQDAKSIRFEAADKKTARKGLRALAKAGFGGEGKVDGKLVKLPAPNIEEGATAGEVKLTHVHLCCGACVKAVEGAVSKVEGVAAVTCDRETGTCVATGENVSIAGVLQALRDAGFNGTLPGQGGKNANQKNKKKNAN
jgi:periplasmic mercuric ion binding protein